MSSIQGNGSSHQPPEPSRLAVIAEGTVRHLPESVQENAKRIVRRLNPHLYERISQEVHEKIRHTEHEPFKEAGVAAPDKLTTVVFADDDEYVRFTTYVYERYGGRGIALTNVPLHGSIRVRSWLLEETNNQFTMQPVTQADIKKATERLHGRQPFDPQNLADFHVPGLPTEKESSS